jgi:hypothetical protein
MNSSIILIRLDLSLPPGNPTCEAAVVVTLTAAVAAVLPFNVTEAGEIVQAAPVGAPLQLNATLPLNPPLPASESAYVAVVPAATVALPPDPADNAKSGVAVTSSVSNRLCVKPPPVPTTPT